MTTYHCPVCKTTTQVGPTRDYKEEPCRECREDPNFVSALGERAVCCVRAPNALRPMEDLAMTPDEVAKCYKLIDLQRDLEEANALAFRCSEENVTLRLQLSTALAETQRLKDDLEGIRLFCDLHHASIDEMRRHLKMMIDEALNGD